MKKLFATIIVASTAAVGFAATPLWMRDVKISPDGKQIAFCYKGDIYKVASTGGSAVRLTSHDSYESVPVWSPDGKQIAFASDRYGNNDVFIMNADGGSAVRLTTKSGGEVPEAFSPDGKYVYFSANNQKPAASALFPDVLLEPVQSASHWRTPGAGSPYSCRMPVVCQRRQHVCISGPQGL